MCSSDLYIVTHIELALKKGGRPTLKYAQLVDALGGQTNPSLKYVADTVTRIRRKKSMVLDPNDPNHRSAGSFFTNPIVNRSISTDISRRTKAEFPAWDVGNDNVKLSAAWLIDNAGMHKGYGSGRVGLSTTRDRPWPS